MKDLIAESLAYIAAAIHIFAFCRYGRSMVKNRANPNSAMLLIWAFGSFITLFNYDYVAGDFLKETVAMVDSIGCLGIFFVSIRIGKFSIRKLRKLDCFIVMADVVAIVVWRIYDSAMIAYYILLVSAAFSIVPMCIDVWEEDEKEDVPVWFLWTSAYFISGIVVILRWTGWKDIGYQITYTLMHLAVALVCVMKAKKLKHEVATTE